MAAANPPTEKQGPFARLVLVALVLVLAYQLAYWTWVFVAPQRATAPATDSPQVDLAAIARMFGASPPGASQGISASGLRLKGVVAPTPPGVAASRLLSCARTASIERAHYSSGSPRTLTTNRKGLREARPMMTGPLGQGLLRARAQQDPLMHILL